jgi:NAD+ synthase
MKSEVFMLAAYLKVPDSILNAVWRTVWRRKTDEAQLGATYDELEWAMIQDQEGKSATDFSDRKRIVYEIYKRLNKINQHKMKSIPIV